MSVGNQSMSVQFCFDERGASVIVTFLNIDENVDTKVFERTIFEQAMPIAMKAAQPLTEESIRKLPVLTAEVMTKRFYPGVAYFVLTPSVFVNICKGKAPWGSNKE